MSQNTSTDITAKFLRGAEVLAAGKTLGLTPDQTFALVQGMQASNPLETRGPRSSAEAEADFIRSAEGIKGLGGGSELSYGEQTAIDTEEAYGRSEEEFREFLNVPGENEYNPEDKYTGKHVRYYQDGPRKGRKMWRLESGNIIDGKFTDKWETYDAVRPEEKALYNPDIAPRAALLDSVRRLEEAKVAQVAANETHSWAPRALISKILGKPQVSADKTGILQQRILDHLYMRAADPEDLAVRAESVERGMRLDPMTTIGGVNYVADDPRMQRERDSSYELANQEALRFDNAQSFRTALGMTPFSRAQAGTGRFFDPIQASNTGNTRRPLNPNLSDKARRILLSLSEDATSDSRSRTPRTRYTVAETDKATARMREEAEYRRSRRDGERNLRRISDGSPRSRPIASYTLSGRRPDGELRPGTPIDPQTGAGLGQMGPELPPRYYPTSGNADSSLGSTTSPYSAETLKAYPQLPAADFVVQSYNNAAARRTGGQVDITGITGEVARRAQESGFYPKEQKLPANIRTTDELGRLHQQMVGSGKQMTRWSDTDNKPKNIRSDQATVDDSLSTLGFTREQSSNVGRALGTMALTPDSERKEKYMTRQGEYAPSRNISFDSSNEMLSRGPSEGGAQVARAGQFQREKAPRGMRGIAGSSQSMPASDLSKRLRTLNDAPYIGQAIDPNTGEPELKAGPKYLTRFKSKNLSGLSGEGAIRKGVMDLARSRAKGKPIDIERERRNATNAIKVDADEFNVNSRLADRNSEMIAGMPPNARREDLDDRPVFIPGQPMTRSQARPGRYGFKYS